MFSLQLPGGQAYRLRFRLSGRLGNHELIIDSERCTTPETQSHSSTDPERVGNVALFASIDACFSRSRVFTQLP